MSEGVIKLAIGIPAYGDALTAHHARMWLELGNVLGASPERFGLVLFTTVDINPIDRARDTMLAQAMLKGADWLFTIDADTWVEANGDEDAGFQILRMISDADRKDAAIICAPVRRRTMVDQPGPDLMIYRRVKDPADYKDTAEVGLDAFHKSEMRRALMPIDACATACIAMNLHKIAEYEARFKFNPPLSEDLDFCRQVRDAGGTIFVDGRIKTGHKSRSFALYSDQ